MCKALARLLDVPEEGLSLSIHQLEQASGYPSSDVRLTAEIVGKVYMATKALGLDPVDTTGPELYHSLIGLVAKHDEFLVRRIGGKKADNATELAPKIVHMANRLKVPKQVWAIKHTAIKRLLKQQIPKRAMKQLGYRSLDSLLKREPIGRLVTLLPILESERWYKLFVQRYQQLTPADFEHRDAEVLIVAGPKWQDTIQGTQQDGCQEVIYCKEAGVIVLLPELAKQRPGYTISTFPQVLHNLAELRLHSAYLKLMQTRPNFGEIVASAAGGSNQQDIVVSGQGIGWGTIHRHLAKQTQTPELFEPHISADDFLYHRTEEVLYHLEPALHFWHDMEYVGVNREGRTTSFNILDMAQNLAHGLPFARQKTTYLQNELWDQLLLRYVSLPHVEARVLAQLDYQAFDPELLALAQVEDF